MSLSRNHNDAVEFVKIMCRMLLTFFSREDNTVYNLAFLSTSSVVSVYVKVQDVLITVQFSDASSIECVQLSKHIQAKLDGYIKVLRTTKITVENIYQQHTQRPVDHRFDCCKLLPADLR